MSKPPHMARGSSKRKVEGVEDGPGSGSKSAKSGETGLTAYMGATELSFSEDVDDEDDVAELSAPPPRSKTFAGKALSAISFSRGGKAGRQEVSLMKPNQDDILGITFEVPADAAALKGVVVTDVHPDHLVAKSKKLKPGDVVHVINGKPINTPEEGAMCLRNAKGIIQLVITRAGAKPKVNKDVEAVGELDKTRSFLPMSVSRSKKSKKKADQGEAAADEADEANTTVVVSCSQLIVESKRIIGTDTGLDEQLDSLYAKLKAKELPSQTALQQLIQMVGQTTVEQAGLVIANAQQGGGLPDGWVEYWDPNAHRYYYYNVHTKTTTWTKPKRDRPPPPPPLPPPARRTSSRRAVGSCSGDSSMEASGRSKRSESGGSAEARPKGPRGQAHDVADALLSQATRRKMVETVQIECSIAPRHGIAGLVSVSL